MQKIYLSLLCCILLPTSLYAESKLSPDIYSLLNEDINKYSQIATDTRQNVDYMPYVISVLESQELNKLGVLTLRDALNLVPGVDLSIGMAGIKNPVFRGSNPYALGQSKLVIDGVVVNDTLFGAFVQYLDMPVDLIQRIEVVRGPGSLLSHVNGYSGSIHVITKANRDDGLDTKDEYFTTFGSDKYINGGFVSSYDNEGLEITVDGFYQQHEQSVASGLDRFGNLGELDQGIENFQFALNIKQGALGLKSRFSENNSGVSIGQAFSVTDDPTDYLDVSNNFLEMSFKQDVFANASLNYVLGYLDESRQLQNKVMPDGAMLMLPPPPVPLPNGRYFIVDYKERTFSGRIELEFNADDFHNIKAGLQFSTSKLVTNNAAVSDDNLLTFNSFNLLTAPDRDHYSFYVDDLIDIDEHFSLQLGLKVDGFNDVDKQFSPRIAAVYRRDNENIFKFMYTRSFREPSWREQYLTKPAFFSSTGTLNEETVHAYEASYIKRTGNQNFFKANLYYLQNKEQIHAQNGTNTFLNSGDNELYGTEFEYKTTIAGSDKLYVNYSYVDGKNVFSNLASSAQNMAKLYYIHNITDKLSISGITKYVGEKGRVSGDTRSDVPSYTVIDLAVNYKESSPDLSLTLGVTNAPDNNYFMPSPENTYVDDFEQLKIGFYLRLKGSF